jgi:O-antigen biosynthesis protein
MSPPLTSPNLSALHAEGPWFRDESGQKVTLRGITYGPFKPNLAGDSLPAEPQLRSDLQHIASLGFNVVRLYEPPSVEMLEVCRELSLRLFVGISWTQHVDFLADPSISKAAVEQVASIARQLKDEPSVAALIVGNEIEKTLVRWMGPERVRDFLEKLITTAHEAAPGKLAAYASYPSTEYLVPRNADFLAYNVFLEKREAYTNYLQHLQNLAGDKPLVISEFGLDSQKHGETAQAETLQWQREITEQAGVAGSFWFAYTDEWYRGGEEVTGWDFGIVRRDRTPKSVSLQPSAFSSLPSAFISVIVCTRNGSATLRGCLQTLSKQSHPGYEVLLIDDGSTDETPAIAAEFPSVNYHRQEHAGLSAARNLGMKLARHPILAYTDDDCLPDEDWLMHLSRAYDDDSWVAAGGPNLPPPPRNLIEACVAKAPGGPSHVLLNDSEAEHLPGCNLSIRKSALEAIGGFRDEFKTAGDDVDVCWRLQAAGGKLRFVPAALVWHHRRFTVEAYLQQQRGYGHAEAMLMRRHGERFAWFGGARWRGAIYGSETSNDMPPIQHGRYGLEDFQCLYQQQTSSLWHHVSGLPWLALTLLVFVLGLLSPSLWLTSGAMFLLMLLAAWRRTEAGPNRTLLWWLCLMQPLVRDWARLRGMIQLHAWPQAKSSWSWPTAKTRQLVPGRFAEQLSFWSETGVERTALLKILAEQAEQSGFQWREAAETSLYDVEMVSVSDRRAISIGTVTEYHPAGKTLTRVGYKISNYGHSFTVLEVLMFFLILMGVPYLPEWMLAVPIVVYLVTRCYEYANWMVLSRRIISFLLSCAKSLHLKCAICNVSSKTQTLAQPHDSSALHNEPAFLDKP